MSEQNPVNYCTTCGQDFGSVKTFDLHRVGRHEYTYSEGARMEPPRDDGRRCLSISEMEERGWELNKRDLWYDPVHAAKVRQSFATT